MTKEHLETGAGWFAISLVAVYGWFMWLPGAALFYWIVKPSSEVGSLLSIAVGAVLWWLALSVIAWLRDLR